MQKAKSLNTEDTKVTEEDTTEIKLLVELNSGYENGL